MRKIHFVSTYASGLLRRGARASTFVASGALIVALGLSAPAGAATHYVPRANGANQVAATEGAHITSPVAPLTLALVYVTDLATGATTLVESHTVAPTTYAGSQCGTLNANAVCLQFPDNVNPTLFIFGGINGPGIYTSTNGGDQVQAGGASCFGGPGSKDFNTEVDQFQFSGGTETAVAVQFDCNNGVHDISGTIAYNIVPTDPGDGYYVFGQGGELSGFGNDNYLVYLYGAADVNLNAPIVGMAATPDGGGYWMVGSDGGVFGSGDAQFYGSTGNLTLNKPIVGMAATPDGRGYYFVASDGGVFTYGDAVFHGSTGGMHLNKPIVGMALTPNGGGYWLVASDGGIFSYGNAQFYGSTGSMTLNKPIVGMASVPNGNGYWLVASDGGIFAYGHDAQFYGSTGAIHLNSPVVGMVPTQNGGGYWFVASDGGVFNYGNAPFDGSLGGTGVNDAAGLALGGQVPLG